MENNLISKCKLLLICAFCAVIMGDYSDAMNQQSEQKLTLGNTLMPFAISSYLKTTHVLLDVAGNGDKSFVQACIYKKNRTVRTLVFIKNSLIESENIKTINEMLSNLSTCMYYLIDKCYIGNLLYNEHQILTREELCSKILSVAQELRSLPGTEARLKIIQLLTYKATLVTGMDPCAIKPKTLPDKLKRTLKRSYPNSRELFRKCNSAYKTMRKTNSEESNWLFAKRYAALAFRLFKIVPKATVCWINSQSGSMRYFLNDYINLLSSE